MFSYISSLILLATPAEAIAAYLPANTPQTRPKTAAIIIHKP